MPSDFATWSALRKAQKQPRKNLAVTDAKQQPSFPTRSPVVPAKKPEPEPEMVADERREGTTPLHGRPVDDDGRIEFVGPVDTDTETPPAKRRRKRVKKNVQ